MVEVSGERITYWPYTADTTCVIETDTPAETNRVRHSSSDE